ncbi:ABC transporter substrate-binding protein [Cytobacillus sp. IB215316]|uniref:ABC transporter substrate-binding protein n=1 Tax=Cytobacillus sp. IB215316 TaxID=3097354 RepID=UPI002A18455B|nr:ABC transporter substrate-binding protein [Cytobacillus sp. IB215316]MDX8360232.1 ABC transporter substrate-binding protein [Cytobacillus sp. IB215316]
MKVVSCVPAATHMINSLGLDQFLSGVTFECPSSKPKVVRSVLEDNQLTSSEINETVSEYMEEQKSLYYIDQELLEQIEPDIMFTQHVCDVCQIGTSYVEKAIYKLSKQPKIVPLIPKNLNDIFDNVITVAKELGSEQKGIDAVKGYKDRLNQIQRKLMESNRRNSQVFFMEWINPIYNSGHWIPDLVHLAGGDDIFAKNEGHSNPIKWEDLKQYDPEIIIISPCGYDRKKAVEEVKQLQQLDGWKHLRAVNNNNVYLVDPNLFTQPSIGVIDGVELLAALFHSDIISMPKHLTRKYIKI